MSADKALEFMNAVCEQSELQQEVKNAVEGKSTEQAIDAVTELAGKQGYDFTADEMKLVRAALHERLVEDEILDAELSDEQLEAVAGGTVSEVPVGLKANVNESVLVSQLRSLDKPQSQQFGNTNSWLPKEGPASWANNWLL